MAVKMNCAVTFPAPSSARVRFSASVGSQPFRSSRQLRCAAAKELPERKDAEMISEGAIDRRGALLSLAALAASPALMSPQPASAAATPVPGSGVPGASPLPDGTVTLFPTAEASNLTPSEKQVLALNKRIQAQNRAPLDFPNFVRNGFDVKVLGDEYKATSSGLLYKDFKEGSGSLPVDGQEVVFNYTGYNESGAVIDTSYRQGRPAQTRLGIQGLIPGFEEGIRGMKAGQQRRIIIPPALGPPVGPSTFFSAKQCEVFDIELLQIRTCERRQMAMFSDVVCT